MTNAANTVEGAPLIRVVDLHKHFNKTILALNGITEEITKGEKIVVIGPSGCGKSTFLRCLPIRSIVCRCVSPDRLHASTYTRSC